jgi:hypothetical protein
MRLPWKCTRKTCRYGNAKVILNDQQNNLRRQGAKTTSCFQKKFISRY